MQNTLVIQFDKYDMHLRSLFVQMITIIEIHKFVTQISKIIVIKLSPRLKDIN